MVCHNAKLIGAEVYQGCGFKYRWGNSKNTEKNCRLKHLTLLLSWFRLTDVIVFVSNDFRLEVIVCLVDIGVIIQHLSIFSLYIYFYKYITEKSLKLENKKIRCNFPFLKYCIATIQW